MDLLGFNSVSVGLKTERSINSFARFFGVYYEWLLAPWIESKGTILVGPGESNKEGLLQLNYRKPKTVVKGTDKPFVYDWFIETWNGERVLIEAKCWINYSDFKGVFEDNDYQAKFKDKYPDIRDHRGLSYFVCHEATTDFKLVSPFESTINSRWLLWWESKGGTFGEPVNKGSEVMVFSIKDIINDVLAHGDRYRVNLIAPVLEDYLQAADSSLRVLKKYYSL